MSQKITTQKTFRSKSLQMLYEIKDKIMPIKRAEKTFGLTVYKIMSKIVSGDIESVKVQSNIFIDVDQVKEVFKVKEKEVKD